MSLAAPDLVTATKGWFRRLRRSDGLSRIVLAAAGTDFDLPNSVFAKIRHLLEQESTWVQVGRGRVEDLVILVTGCFPDPAGESSLPAARAIVAGLLEFSVRSIEPEWFPQVLLARLDRMEAHQASAMDQAMARLDADLAAQLAVEDTAAADRFASVMHQLGQVLDRLPPGAADEGKVAIYLATLIRWLNSDPWPQNPEVAGPELTPAAIERKLRITSEGSRPEEDLDADDLGRQCSRLVVLGGPGSGKTWLAKRTARLCAEAALKALVAGATVTEVELPLYTTCAWLSEARTDDSIRRAVVASALGHLPDLGSARVHDAVQVLFEERAALTLLIVDSLDEAREADDRIRTLPQAWRIMLTTRPADWNRQLAIKEGDPSQRVGVLQPLRYPDDVGAFIVAWFGEQRYWAAHLRVQLHDRPNLQQAATVPLILAFYCIIGGGQPIPSRRTDLYDAVIEQMLIGPWRGSAHRIPDIEACQKVLRGWAWSAAASNPISGVATWEDEFPTPRVSLSEPDSDALDHVAVPLPRGPADVRNRTTRRRFVHRSLREHLVAKHVACVMSAEEAAGELLKHLWYDPDWEYAAPAALTMHPQRDQVLKELIGRVTGDDQLRADIAAFDGGQQFRQFLARVAQESGEADWSAEAAEVIGRARSDLAGSRRADLRQVVATDWPASNGLIIETLLGSLANEWDEQRAREQADTVVRLAVTAADRAKVSEALLALITESADHARTLHRTLQLPSAVVRLAVTPEDLARTKEALLGLLTVIAEDPAADREEDTLFGLFPREPKHRMAQVLADIVAQLDPVPGDLSRVREALLHLLDSGTGPWMAPKLAETVTRLDPAAGDLVRAREALLNLLVGATTPEMAAELADAVARLGPAAEDLARAKEVLLEPFIDAIDGQMDPHEARRTTRGLANAVVRLAVTAEDQRRAREALLAILAQATNRGWGEELADAIARLAVTAEDRTWTREALLGILADATDPAVARQLADTIAQLDPAAGDLARAREALLGILANLKWAGELPSAIARLAVTGDDRASVRETVLGLLADATNHESRRNLAKTLAELDPTSEDLARAREIFLGLLADATNGGWASELADVIAKLDPTAEDLARAREPLLGQLAGATRTERALGLARRATRPDPKPEDLAEAKEALPGLLVYETDPEAARTLAGVVAGMDPAADHLDRARWSAAREALLMFTSGTYYAIFPLAHRLAELDPTTEDLARAREALLGLLADATDGMARGLAQTIAQLDPAAEDLAKAKEVLFRLLADATLHEAAWGARAVARLNLTTEDRARAKEALLGRLADATRYERVLGLAHWVVRPDPRPEDLAEAKEALLGVLADETNPEAACVLGDAVVALDPAAEDLAKAKEALLGLLANTTDPEMAQQLAETVAQLDPAAKDLAKAKEALRLLDQAADPGSTRDLQALAEAVARLDPAAKDLAKAKEALLGLLANTTDPEMAQQLAETVAQLDPAAQDPVKDALLRLLADVTDADMARKLEETIVGLNPTIADLGRSGVRPIPPSPALLGAARRNSELPAWLAALHSSPAFLPPQLNQNASTTSSNGLSAPGSAI